ncbi:hypothetical protein GCM10025876_05700 [Demequina litorisediminis]|uniref:OCT domain-containing protein n=1 Tax=Demequina litorisediminis TaxID=1849022 RepID=A0ABQ6IAU8_9MICO|nr:hypothetical protein GCM10025876_05700 [Demequina litorisediminis]
MRGAKVERWVKQTNFVNDEAVGYLADRLARAGVEEALFKAGAVPGSEVLIGPREGGVVFDWEPTMMAGAEAPRCPRLRPPRRAARTRRRPCHPCAEARRPQGAHGRQERRA